MARKILYIKYKRKSSDLRYQRFIGSCFWGLWKSERWSINLIKGMGLS